MVQAVLLHRKVGIAGYDDRIGDSQRREKFAPSRKLLVGLSAVIPLFENASVLPVVTASCYLYTKDHSSWCFEAQKLHQQEVMRRS